MLVAGGKPRLEFVGSVWNQLPAKEHKLEGPDSISGRLFRDNLSANRWNSRDFWKLLVGPWA